MTKVLTPEESIQAELDRLEAERAMMMQTVAGIDREIVRFETALAALHGEIAPNGRKRQAPTAGPAILAALQNFTGPVHTTTLLNHESLVHYSRNSLRKALEDLRRRGKITAAERGPKGYIWNGTG